MTVHPPPSVSTSHLASISCEVSSLLAHGLVISYAPVCGVCKWTSFASVFTWNTKRIKFKVSEYVTLWLHVWNSKLYHIPCNSHIFLSDCNAPWLVVPASAVHPYTQLYSCWLDSQQLHWHEQPRQLILETPLSSSWSACTRPTTHMLNSSGVPGFKGTHIWNWMVAWL